MFHICGGGDVMNNPFQEIVFNFGAINYIYPDKLGEKLHFF